MAGRTTARVRSIRVVREWGDPVVQADERIGPGAGDERAEVPVGGQEAERQGGECLLLQGARPGRGIRLPSGGLPAPDKEQGIRRSIVGPAGPGPGPRSHRRFPDALWMEFNPRERRQRCAGDRMAPLRRAEDERVAPGRGHTGGAAAQVP